MENLTIETENTNSMFVPNDTLVVYEGGGYDGCFWAYNAFLKDAEDNYHNIHSTGYNGIKTENLNDSDIEESLEKKNAEFIDLNNEVEVLKFTKSFGADNVFNYGCFVNKLYEEKYDKEPMKFICEKCGSIEVINIEICEPIGCSWQGGLIYSSENLICKECYSENVCEECGEYCPNDTFKEFNGWKCCENCYAYNIENEVSEEEVEEEIEVE